MSPLTRRALVGAAATALLTGCGGPSAATPTAARDARRRTPARDTEPGPSGPPSARPSGAVPVQLLVPAIDVDTPVITLGLAPDGTVEVPPVTADDRAGWYRHSPPPGQIGPSVILGHVTVGRYGDGVFRHLARLHRGDRITARLSDGGSAGFAVREVRTVAKADFPTDDVYGDVDRPELRLITCGGTRTGDGYTANVIVFAEQRPGGS